MIDALVGGRSFCSEGKEREREGKLNHCKLFFNFSANSDPTISFDRGLT